MVQTHTAGGPMKFYYYNDELQPVTVQVNGRPKNELNPSPTLDYYIINPKEGKMLEVLAPADSVIFIKRWENRLTLVSYIEPAALPNLQKSDEEK